MSGRGAERILKIVEWMAGQSGPVNFIDVVKALALPKSSALGLIRILVEAGYVDRLDDGRYRLSRLPGEPTSPRSGWGTLLRHARDPLQGVVDRTGESGFVAVLGEDMGVRYIAKVLPSREIRYDRDITVARRPHQVSSGIVLLGGLDAAALDAYVAAERQAGGLAEDGDTLIEQVAAARTAGIQVNRLGVVEGAGGLAAPIRSRDGGIVAALNIAGPAPRLSEAVERVEPILRESAGAISRSLGWDENPSGVAAQDAA